MSIPVMHSTCVNRMSQRSPNSRSRNRSGMLGWVWVNISSSGQHPISALRVVGPMGKDRTSHTPDMRFQLTLVVTEDIINNNYSNAKASTITLAPQRCTVQQAWGLYTLLIFPGALYLTMVSLTQTPAPFCPPIRSQRRLSAIPAGIPC